MLSARGVRDRTRTTGTNGRVNAQELGGPFLLSPRRRSVVLGPKVTIAVERPCAVHPKATVEIIDTTTIGVTIRSAAPWTALVPSTT